MPSLQKTAGIAQKLPYLAEVLAHFERKDFIGGEAELQITIS